MDEPTTQGCMTTSDATIHTVPLAGEDRVLVLVEANSHVTHVISLTTDGARQMVVGLLDALDVVALCADDDACGR